MNPIRRLVQLVLDRRAAKQTEDAARKALSPVEAGLARLKALAVSVGSVLAAAFGVRALARFGLASVKAAMESEAAWADLAGTVRAAGGDFEAMEADVRALAIAFQEATAIGDEEFAGGLTKLIALTGDVSAATNNMGLVANVAAQFYKGDLAPAVELVGKVMNGNTTLLQRMGIKVQSAQEGLEVLAERSFGAASRQAETFGGKVKQLTNFWGDFQEELGAVITTSEEGVGALDVLIGVVRLLTGWVQRNREVIQVWIRGGLEAAIDVVDVLWRALKGMSQLIVGGFATALGLAIQGTGLLARGLGVVVEVGAKAARFFGATELAESMTGFSDRLRDQAAALNEWGAAVRQAGEERVAAGVGTLSRQAFTGEGVLEGAAAAGRAKGEVPPELSAAPEMAAGAVTRVSEAIEEYENAIRAAHLLSETLGKDFDLLGAEASALTTVITKLSNEGIAPQDPLLQGYVARLREVQQQMKETNAIQAFEEQMRGVAAGSELLGGSFDALSAKASALEQVIASLTAAGVDPSDARLQQYAQTLGMVQAQMAGNIEVADEFGAAMGAAMGAGIGPFAAGKARQNLIEAAELAVRAVVAAINPFTAAQAPVYALAAAKHVAIAGAWAALASQTGGFAGAGGAGGGGSGGSPGGALGLARGAGAESERAEPPGPEVHIHLVGPGFDAMNPEVQRVVWGAGQMAKERFGANATIHQATRGRP